MNETQKLVHDMLMHNTGIHMMDSGGGAGRHWQRNAEKPPKDAPDVVLDIPVKSWTLEHNGTFVRRGDKRSDLMAYKGLSAQEMEAEGYVIKENRAVSDDIGITVNLYHYLPTVLELDELCDAFNALPVKDWESETYGVSTAGAAWLKRKGFTIGDSWNTYNGEYNISQTLQGTELKIDGLGEGDYVLLQVHGGADVRGGYTDAKLFKYQRFQEFINPVVDVWAQVRRGNDVISLTMQEHGYGFGAETPEGFAGEAIEILEGDVVEAGMMER